MAPPSPSWSDIPLEVAVLFLRRLPTHVDRVRFAAVCCQWRAAAREVPPLPLLALPDGTVYSLPGSEPLRLPSCTGYDDACGNWLAFSTKDGCFLRDPFTKATVTLPQLLRIRAPCRLSEARVSWIDLEYPLEKHTMYKPVFCSRQLVATFIRFQFGTFVAVCQPGAASWWSVHVDHRFELSDDMVFHQGNLYILNDDDHSLFAMDIGVDHRTGAPWICQVRPVITGVVIPRPAIRGICLTKHQKMLYLVESESHGTLLMVHRKTYGMGGIGPRWLVAGSIISLGWEFEVFMADFQQSKWTKVTTIGDDQVLFLRRRCSRFVRVSPEEMPGDRIIFLDRDDEDHDWFENEWGGSASDSCKVYDMRDGTVSPFVPSVHWERRSAPATWLFPQTAPDTSAKTLLSLEVTSEAVDAPETLDKSPALTHDNDIAEIAEDVGVDAHAPSSSSTTKTQKSATKKGRGCPSPNKKAAKKLFSDEDAGDDVDQGFADDSAEPSANKDA